MSIHVDPDTGLKVFNTRAAQGDRQDRRQGLLDHRRRGAQGPAAHTRRARCSTPRSRRSTASSRRPAGAPPTTWRWRASSPSTSRTSTRPTRCPREALTDECDILVVGAGFAGPAALVQAARRRASSTSASARRAATSAAPGTGTATRASPATSSPTATCRCSRRWATSRR